MGRPIYSYELGDPDFSWLISNFQEHHPDYGVIEHSCLPVVFIEKTGSFKDVCDPEGLALPLPGDETPEEEKLS